MQADTELPPVTSHQQQEPANAAIDDGIACPGGGKGHVLVRPTGGKGQCPATRDGTVRRTGTALVDA